MVYTYVLLSEKDGEWYTGSTRDLRVRVRQHAEGRVRSTASRRPLTVIYYEACMNLVDAFRRERFLKTGKGKRFLKKRLADFLAGLRGHELERAK
jgi:putative endonuclease